MKKIWKISLVLAAALVIAVVALLQQERPSPEEPEPVTEETERPSIRSAKRDQETAEQYKKMEWTLELSAEYDNPYDPEEIDLRAEFNAPSGRVWLINGFFDGGKWRIRFAADETGEWTYRILVTDKNGTAETEPSVFQVDLSGHHGWLQVSKSNPRTLSYHDGTSFYGIGIALPWNVTESKLDRIAEHGGNLITYWNGNYDTAGIGGGKNQLESVQSGIGKYDVMKGYRIDQLVEWFEQRDLVMNFVIWPHDSLADKIDWPSRWHDNAYSMLGEAVDFYSDEKMWRYQEKLYRYIIARWGYSRAIGIWDLICEINGTDGWMLGDQKAANAWVSKVHRYFKDNDPFQRPTKGSMAGGIDDYWDHGYRTFDIADRENYFDLHYSAYAEDIRNRWENYEKPLFIGETGNVTDVRIYHNALWVSLANGLASSPIWWDESKMNDEMFKHMQVFAEFVDGIDIADKREPVELTAPSIRKQMDAEMPLSEQGDLADWSLPDWAEANKDGAGKIFAIEQDNEGTVASRMRFASGGFAQGVIEHAIQTSDWSMYDEFQIELFVEHDGAFPLMARPVLFPDGRWTEGGDASDITVPAGRWVTLKVPLHQTPSGYWRDAEVTEQDLSRIQRWGIKLYAVQTDTSSEPVTIRVRNPKVTAAEAPVVSVSESRGWMMSGERTSYGWIVTDNGSIGGKTVGIEGIRATGVTISWYDTTAGTFVSRIDLPVQNGAVTLKVPELERSDVAFTMKLN